MGDAALAAVKVANAVAHKQAAYDMELAKHATHAALEMENTRRSGALSRALGWPRGWWSATS